MYPMSSLQVVQVVSGLFNLFGLRKSKFCQIVLELTAIIRVGIHADIVETGLVDIATGLFVDLFGDKTAYVVGATFGIDF